MAFLKNRVAGLTTRQMPQSVTGPLIPCVSIGAFLVSAAFFYVYGKDYDPVIAAFSMLAFISVVIASFDVLVYRAHLRKTTGMNYSNYSPSKTRFAIKLVGLFGTISLLIGLYSILPEYDKDFYSSFFQISNLLIVPFCVLAIPYFFIVDSFQESPEDGYWHAGNALLLRWVSVDKEVLADFLRGWLIKGFFLPLMFVFFVGSLQGFLNFDLPEDYDFSHIYSLFFVFAFFMDLSIATIGYVVTFRPLDTHIRSTEASTLGWVVAIACYAPFWSFIYDNYLTYDPDWAWGAWLWDNPIAYGIWGSAIVFCLCIYTYASAQFGHRFSNLTHRGIITNGVYRWTKHPAYISKNASWWLISIPFIPEDGSWWTAVQFCSLLTIVSVIYYLRAKTEERHLSWDPTYVAYAEWIKKNGAFRWIPDISWTKLA